jgi:hypothetical protein
LRIEMLDSPIPTHSDALERVFKADPQERYECRTNVR